MQFACGGPVVAVREGRVIAGKVQVMNSNEMFTLVLSKKDITFSEAFGNEAYANLDPAYLEQHGEIARLLEYDDTEECVYKGDRGNILYFTASSNSFEKPCEDLDYLIGFVTHGPLSETLANSCNTIIWVCKGTETVMEYVLILDEAFCSSVNLAQHEVIPQLIGDYVRNAHGGNGCFMRGVIRNGVYDDLC